jgi:CRISPR-associated endoribonuclease Cas6
MEVKIELNLKDIDQGFLNKRTIQGLIYNALREDPEFSEKIHDGFLKNENRPMKMFCFSDVFGELYLDKIPKYKKSGFFLIGCMEEHAFDLICSYFTRKSKMQINGRQIEILSVTFKNVMINKQEEIKFKTVSPIIINRSEGKKTIYLEPNTLEYSQSIKNNLYRKFEIIYGDIEKPEIDIGIISNIRESRTMYKEGSLKGYSCSISFKNLDERIIQIILNCGIGSKNSIGFGMLKYEN